MQPPLDPQQIHDATAIAMPTSTILETLATTAAATLVATASPTGEQPSDGGPPPPQGECRLMGPFALVVQAALGGLALLSLVYKRWRERPQRPLKIWFFDVSKQVFGSVLVHIANIFMSMLTSGRFSVKTVEGAAVVHRLLGRQEEYTPNPCSFYLLNLAIDTTIGIPILIILLKVTTGLVGYTSFGQPAESIQSGYYGHPPNAWWWLKQSVIYFIGLFGMKLCVLIIFLILPWISRVGDWALGWTEGNEKLQIAFVMMIFPLIMNALQYYIIDSFIKQKADPHDHEHLPSEDPGDRRDSHGDEDLGAELMSGFDSGSEDEDPKPAAKTNNKNQPHRTAPEEYDPSRDGVSRTNSSGGGSSSSRAHTSGKVAGQGLLPHE